MDDAVVFEHLLHEHAAGAPILQEINIDSHFVSGLERIWERRIDAAVARLTHSNLRF